MKKSTQSLLTFIAAVIGFVTTIALVAISKNELIAQGYANGYETFQLTGVVPTLVVLGAVAAGILLTTLFVNATKNFTNKLIVKQS